MAAKAKGRGTAQELVNVESERKVWVGGLPAELTKEEVEAHFEAVGTPFWVEMMPRGVACVAYDTADEASSAIDVLNGSELGGKSIQVDTWTKPKRPAAPGAGKGPAGKGGLIPGFVGKGKGGPLPGFAGKGLFRKGVTPPAMRPMTAVFNPAAQKSFALSPAVAFGGGKGGAKGLGKGKAKGKDRPLRKIAAPLKVWIGNVAPSVTWKELEEHFQQIGETQWAEVMPRGTACVAYKTEEEAAAALGLSGTELGGQAIEVDVWEAVKPKEAAAA